MDTQYISKGGRITLIRSTLSNLLVYLTFIFQMPRGFKLWLENIQRDFLWRGGALDQRPHLVRWVTVCLDKRKWGLGVRAFLHLIRPSFANGVGTLRMRKGLYGTK